MKTTHLILITSLVSITLSGCILDGDSDSRKTDPPATAIKRRVFVITSDYRSGTLRWLNDAEDSLATDSLPVHQDSYVRGHDSMITVIERMGADNLIRLNGARPSAATVVYQIALGDNSNPMDIAFVPGSNDAFVGLGNAPYIVKINRTTGSPVDSLDISAYKDPENSHPNLQSLLLSGDTLFVTLERRKSDWSNNMPGLLLIVNTRTFSVLDTVNLRLTNPGRMALSGSQLYIGCTGSLPWNGNVSLDSTHGVVVYDRAAKRVSILAYDQELGGAPMHLALDSAQNRLYVVSYVSFGTAGVVYLPLNGGSVRRIEGLNDATGGLAFDPQNGKLYIGDRGGEKPTVKIYANDQLSAIAYRDALPPYDIYVANW